MKILNTVTVMPITHFIMLLIKAVTPLKDIWGLSFDIKFKTITAIAAGKMKALTISTAPLDRNIADG